MKITRKQWIWGLFEMWNQKSLVPWIWGMGGKLGWMILVGWMDRFDIIHQDREFSRKRKILWWHRLEEKLELEKETGYSSVPIQGKGQQQINRFKDKRKQQEEVKPKDGTLATIKDVLVQYVYGGGWGGVWSVRRQRIETTKKWNIGNTRRCKNKLKKTKQTKVRWIWGCG